mmetsp:Transcript_47760/g.112716  ORF Transcript_47760/g.112716 Transcript_47760/m.112716 type:complete len:130 (-) Transcript_47760:1896-2285(-)
MKFSKEVTSSRRKIRKRYFCSNSNLKRKAMVSSLSKNLREKYKLKSIPIRKDDTVRIVRGDQKGKSGKVMQCQRKNFKVLIEKITYNKKNNLNSYIPLTPSNLVIENLSMTNERKLLISKKKKYSPENE